MKGGAESRARLAVALGLSLTAHLAVAWGPGAQPMTRGGVPAGAARALHAQIMPSRPAGTAPASRTPEVAPRYWSPGDLDVRPQVRSHVMPEYPKDLPAGVRGVVVLDVFVSATGVVDRVSVVRAKPVNRFEQSAVNAFSAARYAPGIRKGNPVPSRLRIEVTYGD